MMKDNAAKNQEEEQKSNEADEDALIDKTVQSLVQVACSYGSISQVQQETLKRNMTSLVINYRLIFQNKNDITEGENNGDGALEGENNTFVDEVEEQPDKSEDEGNSVEDIKAAREEVILNGF